MKIHTVATQLHEEVKSWRHHIHKNPEVSMEEYETSAFVKKQLDVMGVSYQEFAGTGIVASIKKGTGNRAIGFRCELDALPMSEANTFAHASTKDGVMHACGHDGHTAMLLGAVKALKDSEDFDGTVHFVFQPGEEGSGGAEIMMNEGLFDACPMEEIYAMHNWPGVDVGKAGVVYGAVMAATDSFYLTIAGRGGHAAMPDLSVDPVIASSHIIMALQTLVSRNVNPADKAVLSATIINGGSATNIIPDSVSIGGTVRTFLPETRDLIERRIEEVAKGFSMAFNVDIKVNYERGYPATFNATEQSQYAQAVMSDVLGAGNVADELQPCMGGEDFSYMLEKVPGNYIWLGNGDSKNLHNTGFDFNDDIIPLGISYWMAMAKSRLPATQ